MKTTKKIALLVLLTAITGAHSSKAFSFWGKKPVKSWFPKLSAIVKPVKGSLSWLTSQCKKHPYILAGTAVTGALIAGAIYFAKKVNKKQSTSKALVPYGPKPMRLHIPRIHTSTYVPQWIMKHIIKSKPQTQPTVQIKHKEPLAIDYKLEQNKKQEKKQTISKALVATGKVHDHGIAYVPNYIQQAYKTKQKEQPISELEKMALKGENLV